MLDTTSYADKLPQSLNETLKEFTGGECVMVRKVKDNDKRKGKSGNCHINVQKCIDNEGGSSVSGWLLKRNKMLLDKDMYAWNFHSVWKKPDGKLLDVTEDKNYVGRDKSIFVPDSYRVPDLAKGLSYNSFIIFTNYNFAKYYSNAIGIDIIIDAVYWCDNTLTNLIERDKHSGEYLLLKNYPNNLKKMCDQYDFDYIDGKFIARAGSKYEGLDSIPVQAMFDYNLKINS